MQAVDTKLINEIGGMRVDRKQESSEGCTGAVQCLDVREM